MRTLIFAAVVILNLNASSAFADSCQLMIPISDIGPKATFSEADISKLISKGYHITNNPDSILEGALTIMTGSSCATYLGLWQSCEYMVQVGRPSYGNSVSFALPVSGSSLSQAIDALATCP